MRFNKDWLEKRWVANSIALSIAVIVYLIFSHLNIFGGAIAEFFSYFSPVILALIIAYVLNPLVKLFQNSIFKKMKRRNLARNISILISVVLLLVFLTVLTVALVPQLAGSVATFFTNFNTYADSLQHYLANLDQTAAGANFDISTLTAYGDMLLEKISNWITENLDHIINTSINVGSMMVSVVIAFILAIYFLADKERLQEGFKRLLRAVVSDKTYRESADFWKRCNTILLRYIGGDLLDGLIVGVANFIFMMLMDMPYAALVSVVVGTTNLAPTFGPLIGGLIGALIMVLVNPWYALWFIIFTIAIQTVDGYVIKPKLFGNTLGVPAIWILITIIVGGRMFGVIGILLAIPFAAIFSFIYTDMIMVELEKRKEVRQKKEAGKSVLREQEKM
ncbi:MAG: AI-2E family transporter [Lachnospiraceae bacterium]|nr:AI-2E family transporter [Lachnospiraceae bacterium]